MLKNGTLASQITGEGLASTQKAERISALMGIKRCHLEDGHYISAYCHVDALDHHYGIALRHDHNISLWRKNGGDVELVQVWELERFSGEKHHLRAFRDNTHFWTFVAGRLRPLGLDTTDIVGVWGTPGINSVSASGGDYWRRFEEFPQHSLAHLFSALMLDKSIFDTETIVALAMDGGPDSVEDEASQRKPYYVGALVKNGKISLFPVASTAPLWALMRQRYGLKEGSLMALAGACKAVLPLAVDDPPLIIRRRDFEKADRWFKGVTRQVEDTLSSTSGSEIRGDPLFTRKENEAAVIARLIQQKTISQTKQILAKIIDENDVTPQNTYLAMSGGLALNCPLNTALMKQFEFKGFLAPPCVNDSGLSFGLGLMRFFADEPDFRFRLSSPYLGSNGTDNLSDVIKDPTFSLHIEDVSRPELETILSDLLDGPIVWFQGQAEIGPRALGHRSLLADPRDITSRDRLNRIKQRQWWRPVAPLVLDEFSKDWFEESFPSPYMLHAFQVKADKAALVPAICHLDGTARVQTLTMETNPELHEILNAFHRATGVPMLCNTSLNDRGEPILNSISAALDFALSKELSVIYADGMRIQLGAFQHHDKTATNKRARRHFKPMEEPLSAGDVHRLNPLGFSREELVLMRQIPKLRHVDHTAPGTAPRLQRLLSKLRHSFGKQPDFQFIDMYHDLQGSNTLEEALGNRQAEPVCCEADNG